MLGPCIFNCSNIQITIFIYDKFWQQSQEVYNWENPHEHILNVFANTFLLDIPFSQIQHLLRLYIVGAIWNPKSGGGDLNNPRDQPKPKPPPKYHPWD